MPGGVMNAPVGPIDHSMIVGQAQRQHQPRLDLLAADHRLQMDERDRPRIATSG